MNFYLWFHCLLSHVDHNWYFYLKIPYLWIDTELFIDTIILNVSFSCCPQSILLCWIHHIRSMKVNFVSHFISLIHSCCICYFKVLYIKSGALMLLIQNICINKNKLIIDDLKLSFFVVFFSFNFVRNDLYCTLY